MLINLFSGFSFISSKTLTNMIGLNNKNDVELNSKPFFDNKVMKFNVNAINPVYLILDRLLVNNMNKNAIVTRICLPFKYKNGNKYELLLKINRFLILEVELFKKTKPMNKKTNRAVCL